MVNFFQKIGIGKNNQNVSYHEVDNVYNLGIKMGAYGGKLLGAGGGGYFFFLISKKNKNELMKKLKKFSSVDVKICQKGTQIIYKYE